MDPFHERLIAGGVTIDEILSGDFEPVSGHKTDTDLENRRLAAWCHAAANGDWQLFERRLQRDRLAIADIRKRFSTARWIPAAAKPRWFTDAIWIETSLGRPSGHAFTGNEDASYPFVQLLAPVVTEAEKILRSAPNCQLTHINETAIDDLRRTLMNELCTLSAPPIYEKFSDARKGAVSSKPTPTFSYNGFIAGMKGGGLRHLFEEKPVLLRLIAVIARRWIDTSQELLQRLDTDFELIRTDLFENADPGQVVNIKGEISETHNNGRSVQILTFADGRKVVYKPKDLRLDACWRALVERLNRASPPIDMLTARVVPREGYGWTEFIDHCEAREADGIKRYFTRAGSLLALFHAFVANDMHQENLIASGEYPVPIDLETILQTAPKNDDSTDPRSQAFENAVDKLSNSVMEVGLLPAYGRSPDNNVFAIGGLTAGWNTKIKIGWENINSDKMYPKKERDESSTNPNLPYFDGKYADFSDWISEFSAGYAAYANFLAADGIQRILFEHLSNFAGIPVRKIPRATRFYAMLLQRLKDHRRMSDGVTWSAQADFVARLADWDREDDPLWAIQRSERAAVLSLDVPYFVSANEGREIRDCSGYSVPARSVSGRERSIARLHKLNKAEIDWQLEVIEANTQKYGRAVPAAQPSPVVQAAPNFSNEFCRREASAIADEIANYAICEGEGAAWIGIDCLGDAEVFQLAALGPDLYNGTSGIGVFLAAHAATTGNQRSAELAVASVAHARKRLRDLNKGRFARSLGIGGGIGLGSLVYALTVIAGLLRQEELRADACAAAELMTDDLIRADKRFDFIGGSAGAILSLLRLYRDSGSKFVLERATRCGDYLLEQDRPGEPGRRCWVGQGSGKRPLNGMSHGAAGFAYAFAALFESTGRQEYAAAAKECIEFENSSFDRERNNWPDLRSSPPSWPCQWCHGAAGIGLARLAMGQLHPTNAQPLQGDIAGAIEATRSSPTARLDTLCCGALGRIEFLCTAADVLGQPDLRSSATQLLLQIVEGARRRGDYHWDVAGRKYNIGLFRGLSGVGYTALRRVDSTLPNVLILQ